MKTILITGATGFVGKNVIERIIKDAEDFSVIAFVDKNDISGINFLLRKKIPYLSQDDLDDYHGDINICLHLASYGVAYGARDVELMVDVNVRLAAKIAVFCSKHNCSLFINTGSCFEYGSGFSGPISEKQDLKPEDLYAASKTACEVFLNTYARINGLKIITIRPFAIYGKYEPLYRLLPLIFDSGRNKKPIELTGGEQIRDYMCVTDVADAIIRLIQNHSKTVCCEAINICSGFALSIKDFILFVSDCCGFDTDLFAFGKKPYRDHESMYFVGDNKRLFEIIGPQDYRLSRLKLLETYESFLRTNNL